MNNNSALYATSSDELKRRSTTFTTPRITSSANSNTGLSTRSRKSISTKSRKKKTATPRTSRVSPLHATSSEDLKANSSTSSRNSDKNKRCKKTRKKKSTIASKTPSSSSSKVDKSKSRKVHSSEKTNPTNNHNLEDDIPLPSLRGMERLSRAVAKASAEREEESLAQTMKSIQQSSELSSSSTSLTKQRLDNIQRQKSPFQSFHHNFPPHYHSSSSSSDDPNSSDINNNSNSVSSLTQLTQVIDSQLYANGPRGTNRGDYPPINGVVQNARDNMISLLGFNQVKGDYKEHLSKSTYNVAIVFGKDLVRDQITVEYASRIRTLARLFKDDDEFRPSLVCFCGGIADGNHVSNADAGYIFFRHMCEAQNIDLDGVGIFIDNASRDDDDTVYCVTEKVKADYVPSWLEASPAVNSLKQKVVNVHFTMISTEYHLCNINDIHHRSPQQSLLHSMESMGDYFKGGQSNRQLNLMSTKIFKSDDHHHQHHGSHDDEYARMEFRPQSSSMRQTSKGAVSTSWSFQYATYPYIYAKDEATVFLGKCYLLGEELMPLLINMKGVVEQREFFQRDNYLMLTSIRRSLVDHIEALHKPSPTIKTALIQLKNSESNERYEGKDIVSILEGALLSLGRCVDLVKPAGLHLGTVSKSEWKRALASLEHSMSEIRENCDPDRPLRPSEWGKLVDE